MDGTQEVIDLYDPVGFTAEDAPAIKTRLRKNGVKNVHSVQLLD